LDLEWPLTHYCRAIRMPARAAQFERCVAQSWKQDAQRPRGCSKSLSKVYPHTVVCRVVATICCGSIAAQTARAATSTLSIGCHTRRSPPRDAIDDEPGGGDRKASPSSLSHLRRRTRLGLLHEAPTDYQGADEQHHCCQFCVGDDRVADIAHHKGLSRPSRDYL